MSESNMINVRRGGLEIKENAEINPFGPAVLDDPYSVYALLRSNDPVHFYEPWGIWLVTDHADVTKLLRDPRLSALRFTQKRLHANAPESTRRLFDIYGQMLISNDAPTHTRLRGLVMKAFTPRVLESMRERVQAVTDELIDAKIAAGEMEIVSDFAYLLPVTVIAEMLGVPMEDRDDFKRWSEEVIQFFDGGTTKEQDDRHLQNLEAFRDYFRPIVAESRRNPKDNLLSALAVAQEKGDTLSEDEVISNCLLLLVAGHETTTNLIGNGLLALLRNPDQLQRLKADSSLIPTAVEELLRYDSPVQWTDRIALEEIEIGGKVIPKWRNIHLGLGAANRDPEAFPDPDRLDIGRRENRHVAFGHGPHFCIGAALARMEGQIAFETILRRLPDLRLADERIVRSGNHAFRRMVTMRVAF